MRRAPATLPATVAFLLSFSVCATHAQSISVGGALTFFKMTDLKSLQEELRDQLTVAGIPAKVTDQFPPTIGFLVGFQLPVGTVGGKDLVIGAFGGYASTGGRIHYQDYSGEVKNDQIAVAYSFGALVGARQPVSALFTLDFRLSLRFIRSTLRSASTYRVGTETHSEEFKFSSMSVGIEPTLQPSINLFGLTLAAPISYLACVPSPLEYEAKSNAYLIHSHGDKVLLDWSGFTLGLALGIEL